jgi:hypothetical protein
MSLQKQMLRCARCRELPCGRIKIGRHRAGHVGPAFRIRWGCNAALNQSTRYKHRFATQRVFKNSVRAYFSSLESSTPK